MEELNKIEKDVLSVVSKYSNVVGESVELVVDGDHKDTFAEKYEVDGVDVKMSYISERMQNNLNVDVDEIVDNYDIDGSIDDENVEDNPVVHRCPDCDSFRFSEFYSGGEICDNCNRGMGVNPI